MTDPVDWRAWDGFVERTPHAGFMQSSWWADFRATHGYGHWLLALRSGSEIVGGALVMRFGYDDGLAFYTIPEGPVLPADEKVGARVHETILGALHEQAAQDRDTVSHVRIEPRWRRLPDFVTGFEPARFIDVYAEPRCTRCVDLRTAEEGILAQMKAKGRYNVRLARRRGVTVVADTSPEALPDFLAIYGDTADRQGMDAKPRDYFEALIALLLPNGRGVFLFADYGSERLATALVVFHGRRATYLFGGSLAAHREVMAPYALHFEAMRRAKARGCEWYDLWGIAPNDDPGHLWHGISTFKGRFGGEVVRLVPSLDHVLDADAYERYTALAR